MPASAAKRATCDMDPAGQADGRDEMSEDEARSDEDRGARQRMEEGIRSGLGILSAFKDALEESIREARERGDLSKDRAKELMREALDKAQSAASGARERLDFVNQSELEALEGAVQSLTERVAALEARLFALEQEGNGGGDGKEA